jgi:hypothetical protein
VRGKHEALIDAKTFMEAQVSLERRRNGARISRDTSHTATWWLRDLARCALCDGKMSAAYGSQHGSRYDRFYFKCFRRCTSRYVPVPLAHAQAEPLLLDRLVELRHELAAARTKTPQVPRVPNVQEKRERLERKRMRTVEAFTDGAMSREEMRKAIARIDEERTKLDALVYVPPPVTTEQRTTALARVEELRRAWAGANPAERRTILFALARSCMLAPGQHPRFEWFSSEELARRT